MAERPNTVDRPEADLARVDEFLYWIEPDATLGGCTLQVRHPEFGWLNFPLTTRAAEELASQFGRRRGAESTHGTAHKIPVSSRRARRAICSCGR